MSPDPFIHFINSLKYALQQELPGLNAQLMLAPAHRNRLIREGRSPENAMQSSVLILIFPGKNNLPETVFMKRVEYDGVHSGQISFPGGKREKTDHSEIDTALREAGEEIGIKPEEVSVIGTLTPLFVPPSNFIISPVVAFAQQKPYFIPDMNEVAEIFTVPLDFFLEPSEAKKHTVHLSDGQTVLVPGYKVNNHLIWGATAMIISELCAVLNSANPIL